MSRERMELVAPAGDFQKLDVALHYGADAVYLGLNRFGLRTLRTGFDEAALAAAITRVHAAGKRAYITVNAILHNRDLPALRRHLRFLRECRPDAIIVSDPGAFACAGEIAPEIDRHISTQANTSNTAAVQFWQTQGAARVVLAREVSLPEIQAIRRETTLPLETFVHGAMCMAYSGRCLLSATMTGRSANSGLCTNSCRWRYKLVEETRPQSPLIIEQGERGSAILSARDLCMLSNLGDLRDAGVSAIKIEGRNRGIEYLAAVTKAYREAIEGETADPRWIEELDHLSMHGLSTGFYYSETPMHALPARTPPMTQVTTRPAGVVQRDVSGRYYIELIHPLRSKDRLQAFLKGVCGPPEALRQTQGGRENGATMKAGQRLDLDCAAAIQTGDVVRIISAI